MAVGLVGSYEGRGDDVTRLGVLVGVVEVLVSEVVVEELIEHPQGGVDIVGALPHGVRITPDAPVELPDGGVAVGTALFERASGEV